MTDGTVFKRMVSEADVVDMVLFLCSSEPATSQDRTSTSLPAP